MGRWLWALIRIAVILAVARSVSGCTMRTDRDPQAEIDATVQEWQTLVGYTRPDLTIVIADGESDGTDRSGQAECTGASWDLEGSKVTIFRGSFDEAQFEPQVRHAVLHELVHVHIHCSAADHSSDPRALMYPRVTAENLWSSPTDADVRLIQEAWIR